MYYCSAWSPLSHLFYFCIAGDTQIYAKINLKLEDKDGVQYFKVDRFLTKIRVGDGWVKLTSKNPDYQFAGKPALIAQKYKTVSKTKMKT